MAKDDSGQQYGVEGARFFVNSAARISRTCVEDLGMNDDELLSDGSVPAGLIPPGYILGGPAASRWLQEERGVTPRRAEQILREIPVERWGNDPGVPMYKRDLLQSAIDDCDDGIRRRTKNLRNQSTDVTPGSSSA